MSGADDERPVVDDVDSLMGGTNPAPAQTFEELLAGFTAAFAPVGAQLTALVDYAKKAVAVTALEAVDARMRARNLATINDELARFGMPPVPEPTDFAVTLSSYQAIEADRDELRTRIEKATTILCESNRLLSERKDLALDALAEPHERNHP